MSKTLPYQKFYGQDWLADPDLRLCSLASRGLLIDLMAIAQGGHPYGHIASTRGPYSEQDLSRMLACNYQTVRKAWAELEQHGRIAQDVGGSWYIPRMVRDYAELVDNQRNGRKGGNPNITKGVNPPLNPLTRDPLKADTDTDTDTDSEPDVRGEPPPTDSIEISESERERTRNTRGLHLAPPTVAECIAEGFKSGVSESDARKFHLLYDTQGWRSGPDATRPMTRLGSCLKRFAQREREFEARDAKRAEGFQPTDHRRIGIDAIKEKIAKIQAVDRFQESLKVIGGN